MINRDIEVLKRCIDKEGFTYAVLYYSSYDESSPEFNRVEDKKFHELLGKLKSAHNNLRLYLKDYVDSDEL